MRVGVLGGTGGFLLLAAKPSDTCRHGLTDELGAGLVLDSWPFPAPISQVGKLTHTVSADDFPGVAELVGAGLGPRPPPPGSWGDGLDAAVGGRPRATARPGAEAPRSPASADNDRAVLLWPGSCPAHSAPALPSPSPGIH